MVAKKYSELQIEEGLLAAATLGIRPAARRLDIPWETVRDWTKHHQERYAELRTTVAAKVREQAAATWEDHAQELLDLQGELVQGFRTELDRIEPKDKPNAIKAVNVAAGIATDKANSLRDRPTVTVEHNINMPQIDKAIDVLLNRGAVDVEHALLDEGDEG